MKFGRPDVEDMRPNLTPMIDIIFQLLIFFVLTAKFVALEGQLQAYLPKDRGADGPPMPQLADDVLLFLHRVEDEIICSTINYQFGDVSKPEHRFPRDPTSQRTASGGWSTQTTWGEGDNRVDVSLDYAAPHLADVEKYLQYRSEQYKVSGISAKGLPVELKIADDVEWQMAVALLDICKRVGITDVTFAGDESG